MGPNLPAEDGGQVGGQRIPTWIRESIHNVLSNVQLGQRRQPTQSVLVPVGNQILQQLVLLLRR